MKIKNILLPLGAIFGKIAKSIPLLAEEAEKLMKDGKITPQERKELVMNWIEIIAKESFGVKLSWLVKLILSFLINRVSEKLPSKDIIIPPFVKKF